MKALLCKEFGPPETLSYEEIEDPVLKEGHIIVDIHSASVNFPDVLMIEDKYQFKPPLPFAPGGEASGVISEIGDGVEGFNVGDRVIASSGWGSFAEKILVDPNALTIIPDQMDHNTAAAFLMTYGTSHHALKDRADIKEGESLLVLGGVHQLVEVRGLSQLNGETIFVRVSPGTSGFLGDRVRGWPGPINFYRYRL